MNALVVYDSKYGNTKLAAQQIAEGIKEASGIETALCYVKDADAPKLADFDVLVIGAPNHMGKPSWAMGKFIDGLAKIPLKAKYAAVFDTYFVKPKNRGKAVRKMEKKLGEKLPNLKLLATGLSVKVEGVNGPVAEGELEKCKEFGRQIANQLKNLT